MQQARGGMGNHKHGVSGRGGPSPKTKFMTAFEANRLAREQAALRPKPRRYGSITEMMRQERR